MNGVNPLDWDATEFLILYGALFIAAMILRHAIANWLRPEGQVARISEEEEIAVLAGGPNRLAEAVTAKMLASGALTLVGKGQFAAVHRPARPTRAEQAVLALGTRTKWPKVRRAVQARAIEVEGALVARGLLIDGMETLQIRLLQSLPLIFLLGFGWVRYKVGLIRGEDVGFLVAAMFVVGVMILWSVKTLDRTTRSARGELASLRAREDRLRRAPRQEETGRAVALYGTAVLAGTSLAGFHQMRSDSGSGGCGSDGGGGCGGGGCGGCGG